MTFESKYVIAIATLSDWLKSFAWVWSKSKTNRTLFARFFPRFEQVTIVRLGIQTAPSRCLVVLWLVGVVSFWFFKSHLKTALFICGLLSRDMKRTGTIENVYSCHGVFTERFIFRSISLEWDPRGSPMTNHKKLVDFTASLGRNCLSFAKEKVYQR